MDDCFCAGFLVGAQKRAVNFFFVEEQAIYVYFVLP